jgi:hypothetical protein
VLTKAERPLTDAERDNLTARLMNARGETGRALVKTGGASGLVCGLLAVATLFASDAPWMVVLSFWAILWLVFTLWIGLPWRKLMRGQISVFEEALRANRAREIRLQAGRVAEFEEEEDEGACYAFEHEPGACIFIVGQEFYEDDDFPNEDFLMAEILGEGNQTVDVMLVKQGKKLQPYRVIPAAVKVGLRIPDHLAVVRASLDTIEQALPAAD